ncbi:MAG: hypothetical protein DIU73_003545 [Actinomycetes bacterium]
MCGPAARSRARLSHRDCSQHEIPALGRLTQEVATGEADRHERRRRPRRRGGRSARRRPRRRAGRRARHPARVDSAILDGEIVALDARGVPSFARLQPRFGLTLPREIAAVQEEAPVTVVFFDVLGINGEDCRSLPYDSRRELLESMVPDGGVASLLLATPGPRGLEYAGRVSGGFSADDRTRLRATMRRLAARGPAADVPASDRRDAHWVRPELVGEVTYRERTSEGRFRHPVWRGLRPDKEA